MYELKKYSLALSQRLGEIKKIHSKEATAGKAHKSRDASRLTGDTKKFLQ